jgi:hypothetical protein
MITNLSTWRSAGVAAGGGRLTAICRKTKRGPLENELVRLRAQVATLEERNADLEEGRDNFDSVYAGFEKQLTGT